MTVQKIKMFEDAFNRVFNRNKEIQVCGRDAVVELIEKADALEPGVVHGNMNTCIMDVASILQLYDRVFRYQK